MNRRFPTSVAFGILCACGQQGATIEQQRTKLEATKRQAYADVIKHEGECRAVAFEFPDDGKRLQNCLDTHRFMIESAERTAQAVERQLAALEGASR
ncbi:hypothetical protein [Azonexus sp.]|uniref:hypothetical protein n=1 Tax=Azonexus sp. TaxID=1872668 RepID=UPI0035B131D8